MLGDAGAPETDLRDYFRILWRRKWLIALVTILALAAALAAAAVQTTQYTATAQVLLQPANTISSLASGNTANALTPVDVATEIQIVTSTPVKNQVASQLGVAPAQVPVAKVSEVGTTNVIQVAASDHVPARAARIANDYAKDYLAFRHQQDSSSFLAAAQQMQSQINALSQKISSLQSQGGSGAQVAALTAQLTTDQTQLNQLQADAATASTGSELVTPAVAPTAPSSPKPKLDALLGLVVGLALGVGGAFLLETLDDRIRDPAELEALSGRPLLGVIPSVASWKNRREAFVVSTKEPNSQAAEAYRQLRTAVQFANLARSHRVLQVTSPSSGEGKSTTAVNLAVTLAAAGQKVILVDADLRRPRVHQFFDTDDDSGLTRVLLGELDVDQAVRPTEVENLSILTSGPIPPNPAELLASPAMGAILADLSQEAVVVVDGPPTLPVTDAVALAARTDAVVLVARAVSTQRKAVQRSVELLNQVGAEVVGLVLNAVPVGRNGRFQYSYGYYGGYGYTAHGASPAGANGTARTTALRA